MQLPIPEADSNSESTMLSSIPNHPNAMETNAETVVVSYTVTTETNTVSNTVTTETGSAHTGPNQHPSRAVSHERRTDLIASGGAQMVALFSTISVEK